MTPGDVEHLAAHRGAFADGYAPDEVTRVLGDFESARLSCVWDYYDDQGSAPSRAERPPDEIARPEGSRVRAVPRTTRS